MSNSELVREVMVIARSGKLLRRQHEYEHSQAVVVDIQRARSLAWEEVYGPEERTWSDIRELEMAQVRARTYSDQQAMRLAEAASTHSTTLLSALRRNMSRDYADLLDDVHSDLYNCIVARAVGGRDFHFFEALLAVYSNGGWPCGWNGEYPAGRIAAYFPPATTST